MKTFRFYNLITGWVVFAIAAIVYLLTMEPTTSFWDCGEFISTAYKLEVGHPPGAPFFMILGKFFTLFAGTNVENIAVTMNVLSALASAFTILFLFWTITHLVRKFYDRTDNYEPVVLVTILGAGVLGALAYTFSDTFWFSAVEAEVYAMSSLFTAVVFWAMLKWENIADQPGSNRWIILIAFLMGISIGTHLLNLLAIPALVFIYYFRKHEFSVNGFLASVGVSILILFIMLVIIIPGIPWLASKFELMFVNGFGLPYFSGVAFYLLILFGLSIFAIYYTRKRLKVFWNTVALAFFVVIVGYSSYAVIVIRSVANTPLDESNPETVFSLLSYLNREQYGDRPLAHGAYFNARPSSVDPGKPTYYKVEDGYEEVVRDRKYKYDSRFEGVFPRMWSNQERHSNEYIYWGKLKESDLYNVQRDASGQPVLGRMGEVQFDRSSPKGKPTFVQNMRFFFRYQVGHMYFRYFMWNFAGRQNDLQGMGELTKGNWISGIKFLDQARLGPQDDMPDSIINNKAHNKYYFLPLIFGLIGLVFHFRRKADDAWVVMLLFILTGLAIVVYLNQYPLQPRERDYAYAGSFYAFAIWIGLGLVPIIEFLRTKVKSVAVPVGVVAISLLAVPGIMAMENWDDHDRSGRYTAQTFAKNYLNSCDENAIIFTNGDNDTFPLWYIQEVEEYRTDVRVVNLSYLTADWYIEQMMHKFYDSDPLPLGMTLRQYRQGTRDYAYLVETAGVLIKSKYQNNIEKYKPEVERLYTVAADVVNNSLVPTDFPKDYKAFTALEEDMDPLRLYSYLHTFNNNEVAQKIKIDQDALRMIISDMEKLVRAIDADYVLLKDAMDFLATDDPRFKEQYFIPSRKFIIPVNKEELDPAIHSSAIDSLIADEVRFRIRENVLYKNSLAQLDIIANNNWERPVYFSNTVSNENFLNLEHTFVQEGLTYRIAPVSYESGATFGFVDTDKMYKNLVEEFEWGGIEDPDVYLDENNLRMTIKYRYSFATLGRAYADRGEYDKAVEVLDYCIEKMPNERVPYNFSIVPVIQSYYSANAVDKALELSKQFEEISFRELDYLRRIINAKPKKGKKLQAEFLQIMRDINTLSSLATGFGETDYAKDLQLKIEGYIPDYERLMR